MNALKTSQTIRRFCPIHEAVVYSSISRGKLYQYAAANPGLFRKNGSATIVDLRRLDELLDNLPVG